MVLDSNKIGKFVNQKPDMIPIYKWIKTKKGKIVYSNHSQIKKEFNKHHKMKVFLKDRDSAGQGQVKRISSQEVEDAIIEIKKQAQKQKYELKSNDIHIVALAKASKAKLLCSADRDLHKDFKKLISKGEIYQNQKNHKKLLARNICPKTE